MYSSDKKTALRVRTYCKLIKKQAPLFPDHNGHGVITRELRSYAACQIFAPNGAIEFVIRQLVSLRLSDKLYGRLDTSIGIADNRTLGALFGQEPPLAWAFPSTRMFIGVIDNERYVFQDIVERIVCPPRARPPHKMAVVEIISFQGIKVSPEEHPSTCSSINLPNCSGMGISSSPEKFGTEGMAVVEESAV